MRALHCIAAAARRGEEYVYCTYCQIGTGKYYMVITLPSISGNGCSNCDGISGAVLTLAQEAANSCTWRVTFDATLGDCGTVTLTAELVLGAAGAVFTLSGFSGSRTMVWQQNLGTIDCDNSFSINFDSVSSTVLDCSKSGVGAINVVPTDPV